MSRERIEGGRILRIADQSGRGTSCGTRANRPQALVCCLIATLALAAAPAGATAWQLPWTTSRLTDTPWGELDPVVSPDGTKILYTHVLPGRYDIYQVNSDGSGPHDLVANSSQMASYTVDGTHVLYDRWLDGGIFKIPVAGGTSTLVIDTQREPCTRPNELPNGCIVFERWWTVPMSIWVADPQDPSHLVRIADQLAQCPADLRPMRLKRGFEAAFGVTIGQRGRSSSCLGRRCHHPGLASHDIDTA